MRSYASRVRTFGMSHDPFEQLKIEAIRAISLAVEAPLMPNLQSLSWCVEDDAHFPYITLFLGAPQLTRIDINFHGTPSRLSLAPKLKALHHRIKNANLTYGTSLTEIEAASALVCSWNSLTTLTCGPLTAEALVHLSSLPALHSLNIYLPAIELSGIAFPIPFPFPTLQLLTVQLPNPRVLMPCTMLLNQMAPISLKRLIISLPTEFVSADLEELFECLRKNMRQLQELVIQKHTSWELHTARLTIKNDMLRQLFSLTKLVKISLTPNCSFDLDDMTLSQMAPSWPSLKELNLGAVQGWRRRSQLRLKSLLIILVHCPDLQELGIVVDAGADLNSMGKPGGFSHNTLRVLHMGDSRVTSAALVAAFLSDIVPCVTVINAWQTSEMERREGGKKYQRKWQAVKRLLSTFVMVREQERHWSEQTRIVDASSMSLGETSSDSDDGSPFDLGL